MPRRPRWCAPARRWRRTRSTTSTARSRPNSSTLLLAHGAEPSATAIAECVACGAPAAARLIADAYAKAHDDLPAAFDSGRNGMLAELETSLAEVRTGEVSHYLGAHGLAERVDHLQSFKL